MDVFAVRGAILSSAHQFLVAYPYYSSHGKHNFSLVTDFYWYESYTHFPHNLPSAKGLQTP